MTGWHFLPMDGYQTKGVLVGPDMKPKPAEFLMPFDAKRIARQLAMPVKERAIRRNSLAEDFGFDPNSLKKADGGR